MPESEQFDATTLVPGPGQKVVSIREWEDLLQEVGALCMHIFCNYFCQLYFFYLTLILLYLFWLLLFSCSS